LRQPRSIGRGCLVWNNLQRCQPYGLEKSVSIRVHPWFNCPNENLFVHQPVLPVMPQGDALAGRVLENCSVIGYTLGMKLSVTIDRDEDGVWVAECPAIPGCVSQGKTKPQALKNIKEAIALCLEVRAERGLPLTVETQQVEVLV
jgi:predicted RNase H-like HicB family nuclease